MSRTKKRQDDFHPSVIEALAKRASYICSNPDCRSLTLCPSEEDPEKYIYTGEAGHITAASPNGPRYDPSLTSEQRRSIENGIFLCAFCATMIDKNKGLDFPADLLRIWKSQHEDWIRSNLNKPLTSRISATDEGDKQLKLQLILEMGSTYNETALRAVRGLKARGWLENGLLQNQDFYKANLSQAELWFADLRGADLTLAILNDAKLSNAKLTRAKLIGAKMNNAELISTELANAELVGADLIEAILSGANLHKADLASADLTGAYLNKANLQDAEGLTDSQLAQASMLRHATMVSGSRYNGCFNLKGDLQEAHDQGVDIDSPEAMAQFYGVSLTDYRRGQEWASKSHLKGSAYRSAR